VPRHHLITCACQTADVYGRTCPGRAQLASGNCRWVHGPAIWDIRTAIWTLRLGAWPRYVPQSLLSSEEIVARQRSTAHQPSRGRSTALAEKPGLSPVHRTITDVIWVAPFYDVSVYADEARALVTELGIRGTTIAAKNLEPITPGLEAQLERDMPGQSFAIRQALGRAVSHAKMAVLHVPGDLAQPVSGTGPTVVRTMYETDSLPARWVQQLNTVDEIWVPTSFNEETFRTAGVTTEISVVPGGVDLSWFRPDLPPLTLPIRASTTFLSVFEWSYRKAPDVLLRAWAEAFAPTDDVALVLRCFPRSHFGDTNATRHIEDLVDAELATIGRRRSDVAPIAVIGQHLSPDELRRLLCSADVYVSPTRGEGWGRPLVEAQACGKLVIATNWSGPAEVLDPSAALLIDIDGLEMVDGQMDIAHYRGQHWASPSAAHLVELMRWAAEHPDERVVMGGRGREDMERRWSWSAAAAVAQGRIAMLTGASWSRTKRSPVGSVHPPSDAMPPKKALRPAEATDSEALSTRQRSGASASKGSDGRPLVRVVGDVVARHSLARVSRELCRSLARMSIDFDVEAVSPEPEISGGNAALGFVARPVASGPCALEVRHAWPPDLGPARGDQLVLVQPWEFGVIPQAWVQPILDHVTEVWTYSEASRQCFVAGGIPAERVMIVPLGVDRSTFRADGPQFTFDVPVARRFLYVGGTIGRKGFDIALASYLNTFSSKDDVSFVVKPFLSDAQYRGMNGDDTLRAAVADPHAPRIEIIDRDLEDQDLAALYRSCDVLLAPYRGEGFGLHILEAMSCGTPAVVTAGGGADGFCNGQTSWMIPAGVRSLRMDGFEPARGVFTVLEPDRDLLADAMRNAITDDLGRATKAAAGVLRSAAWTWDRSSALVAQRVGAIVPRSDQPGASRPSADVRPAKVQADVPTDETGQSSLATLVSSALGQVSQVLSSQQSTIDTLLARIDALEQQVVPAARMAQRWSAVPFCSAAGGLRIRDASGRTVMGFRREPGDTAPRTDTGIGNAAYLDFEDVFRCSSFRVAESVRPYAELLAGRHRVLELGCGRGDLLALLAEAGVGAVGVDSDAGVLSRARARGLDVTQADLLDYLSSQPDCSVDGIVSIEVVEYLDPAVLPELLAEACRVLEPGGMLLAETVNPHNLTAHKLFWLDPTHRHPLFPETLLVLAASAGFEQAYIRFPDTSGDVAADVGDCDRYTLVATCCRQD